MAVTHMPACRCKACTVEMRTVDPRRMMPLRQTGRGIGRRVFAQLLVAVMCPVLCGCNQSSAFVMNESGKALYAQGHFTAARREFERALIDNPNSSDYAFNVASAMRKQGDLIGAERMYRHALNLDPRHQPSHHGLADMLVDQGRVAEADSHLREWADTQPYLAEAHVENAWLRREQGDTAGADQALRRALQSDPRHPVALAHLGDLYAAHGRPEDAQMMYHQSLERNPFQSDVRARLAETRHAWPTSAGLANASYLRPPGQFAPSSMHHASYASPAPSAPNVATPLPMPLGMFQGFASTPVSHPTTTYSGRPPAVGLSYPVGLPVTSPVWPTATLPPASPAAPVQLGRPMSVINADPAHVPTPLSAVPTVTPF